MSLIGLILLMGLVTKNAILLVDYTNVLRSRGVTRREALITAGRVRLRPIVMTTLAMIFGMLPLSFAIGAGSEMRAPMARAVIGGQITSTVLTLLIVPVVYSLLEDLRCYGGCYDVIMLALGKADIWLSGCGMEWDYAPVQVIARECRARFLIRAGDDRIDARHCVVCAPGIECDIRNILQISGA